MISLWDNPIFVRARCVENRTLGSGVRALLHKYGGAFLIMLGPLAAYLTFCWEEVMRRPDEWRNDTLGPILAFSSFMLVLYVTSRALNGTFGSICLEKEQKTYDSLLSTLLTPAEVINGKLAAGLWPVLRELLAVAPFGLVLGALAGYPVHALLFLVLCLASLSFFGLVGLWTSYTSTSTQRANRRGTTIAALFLLGGPTLDWMLLALSGPYSRGHFIPVATFLSPLAAASAITWGEGAWTGTVALYALGCVVLWRTVRKRAQEARQS